MEKENRSWVIKRKHFVLPAVFLTIFWGIAIILWLALDNLFYLFNFCYIGLAIAIGLFLTAVLPKKIRHYGRLVTQFLVGFYMVLFLGIIGKENMQIEGFFFYIFMGNFTGATIHYLIAKIGGTFLFGRGWCGYACWTAAVLDLFRWKQPKKGRIPYFGLFRCVHFLASLSLVLYTLFVLQNHPEVGSLRELYWFLIGNLVYYAVGFLLAVCLQDNRAVCKYICPIPVFQKIGARFALMKINIKREKCVRCFACERACPMDIKLLDYMFEGKRVLSSECISCLTCFYVCPADAVEYTFGLDGGFKEHLRMYGEPAATKKTRGISSRTKNSKFK